MRIAPIKGQLESLAFTLSDPPVQYEGNQLVSTTTQARDNPSHSRDEKGSYLKYVVAREPSRQRVNYEERDPVSIAKEERWNREAVKRVLVLVSNPRSGSTLLSEVLSALTGATFFFEPLRYLLKFMPNKQIKARRQAKLFEGNFERNDTLRLKVIHMNHKFS